jgi:hypothetical protein
MKRPLGGIKEAPPGVAGPQGRERKNTLTIMLVTSWIKPSTRRGENL